MKGENNDKEENEKLNKDKKDNEEKNEKMNEESSEKDKLTQDNKKNKDNGKKVKNRKKRIKKIIYFSIFLFIIVIGLAMLLFSIHVTKPAVSRINEYTNSTFVYELEYYLV
ncbi:MAG: hypothetical protein PWQ87_440, partial [Candidatus Woesearchaeota archaeon]|nr:hypothetical protein [Candidatus Woesearchaeota archaeon]